MVYVREFDGKTHDFGVIGVDKGTLIMYDDQTRSRWSQLFGEAVEGPMKGQTLEKLPSTMTTWGQWRDLHPDTTVYIKSSIPYRARFNGEHFADIARQDPDSELQPNDWIVGLEGHVNARVYPAKRLAQQRLLNEHFEGQATLVYLSSDLTTARVLDREVDGRELTFALTDDDQMRDQETGSLWDPLSGRAVSGELEGKELQPLVSIYALWFAWQKYRPDSEIWGGD